MRVLFVTNEPLKARRSGPAIRCLELARVLAAEHEVKIATLQQADQQVEGVPILPEALKHRRDLFATAQTADVVITQGLVLARYPTLERTARHLVIDLYDPYLFEYLEHSHPQHPAWGYLRQWHRLNGQMQAGDFFLCANERQWDYWLGRLCALGRLDPKEYQRDPNFRGLLAVVPFGLPEEEPVRTNPALRGVIKGIGPKDFILLWAGGIWQWLDPLTPIRAMQKVAAERPEVKLVFLGARDPNPANRAMDRGAEAQKLAAKLGLLNKSVFFHEEWVAYQERSNYLLEADAGISAHPAIVEARFSFRTRVLDYIWAGLPMILSSGDDFGDMVQRQQVGLAVRPGDIAEWQQAIRMLVDEPAQREQMRARLKELRHRYHWQAAAEPLRRYCAAPYRTHRASELRKRLTPLFSSGFEMAKGLRR